MLVLVITDIAFFLLVLVLAIAAVFVDACAC